MLLKNLHKKITDALHQKKLQIKESTNMIFTSLQKKQLEKVGYGIYASSDSWLDPMYLLHLRLKQVIFSHETALFLHSMTDREPIHYLAKEKSADVQLLMRSYIMERLPERISISKYMKNFILKGGILIASSVGLDLRRTIDIDMMIKGFD